MSRERFVELLRDGVMALPQQVKGMLRILEDPDLPDEGRVLAAGTLVHWLSGHNTIPGIRGPLSLMDDLLVIRLALGRLRDMAPETVAGYEQSEPELLEGLSEELEIIRDYLGPGMAHMEKAMDRLDKLKHMGKTATECATDDDAGTMLYEEVQAGLVDLDVDEVQLARALREVDKTLASLRGR